MELISDNDMTPINSDNVKEDKMKVSRNEFRRSIYSVKSTQASFCVIQTTMLARRPEGRWPDGGREQDRLLEICWVIFTVWYVLCCIYYFDHMYGFEKGTAMPTAFRLLSRSSVLSRLAC
jgi:hypothetical protein